MEVVSSNDIVLDDVSNNTTPANKILISDISKTISYIVRGIELNQNRLLERAIRQNCAVRHGVTKAVLFAAINGYIPASCSMKENMLSAVNSLPEVSSQDLIAHDAILSNGLPEIEIFLSTLIVTTLLRHQLNEAAATFSVQLVNRLRTFSRRTLDIFAAKALYYYSLSFERINQLEATRNTLLQVYRTACLHRDELTQAVVFNLILRNYLHYNLIDLAQIFDSKAVFPESASNNQYCRYLYYMGRIQAIQLEYSNSYHKLMMASRKLPQDTARGFNIDVQKLSTIVQLLMGDIPERANFNVPEFKAALDPYFHLTKAVKTGDMKRFSEVVTQFASTFRSDKNYTLVQRLGHNVIKTGIRKISISYSRISLADVAEKLRLESSRGAEYICAKAIKDGVIQAYIDHDTQCLVSTEVVDVYDTDEPQKAFHRRIVFCLDVHNEAVRSMRYPPDAYKKELADSKNKDKKSPSNDEKTIEEIVKEMEDEEDDM